MISLKHALDQLYSKANKIKADTNEKFGQN